MSLRHQLSLLAAMPLKAVHRRRLRKGDYGAMPDVVWNLLPVTVQKWCGYSVFRPNEEFARELVKNHPVMGEFFNEEESSWTLTPASLLFLWRQLVDRKPSCIIEFGSGLSTLVFAAFARESAKRGHSLRILSIEHDADWLSRTSERLEQYQLASYVQPVHAPIRDQDILGCMRAAYDVPRNVLESTASNGGIDFCLIDGPPGRIGRSGCLPIVEPYLAADAFVLLDDAFRPSEQAAWREWTAHWGRSMSHTRILPIYHRGLAVANWKSRDRVKKVGVS